MISIPFLSADHYEFPDPRYALEDPNGLLAVGGDLSPERILKAYYRGIFPWFNAEDPILWWSPTPRTVVFPQDFRAAKSLRKLLRKAIYRVSFDHCFQRVMRACSEPRIYADSTWISEDIIQSYTTLHLQGHAHSVEVWWNDELVGGLYGIALGKVFFGESMFSKVDNTSKIAFAYLIRQLCAWDFKLVDCQVANNHLFSLGAVEITREEFQQILVNFTQAPSPPPKLWSNLAIPAWE